MPVQMYGHFLILYSIGVMTLNIDTENYSDREKLCRELSHYAERGYIPEKMTAEYIGLKKAAPCALDFIIDERTDKSEKYIYGFADKGYAPMCRYNGLYLFAKASGRPTKREAFKVIVGMLLCGGAVMLASILGKGVLSDLLAAVFAAGFGFFSVRCIKLLKRGRKKQ